MPPHEGRVGFGEEERQDDTELKVL